MAEEGRKTSFTASVYKGSEEVFDFACDPCCREGKNVEAVNFCKDCTEYFCLACTKDHKKFGLSSKHNVVNRTKATKTRGGKSPAKVSLPTETCSEHGDERITTYCADHDRVACNTCVSVDHRLCDDVNFIPKICGGSKTGKDVPRVKQEMSVSLTSISTMRLSLQDGKLKADGDKKTQLQHIQEHTYRLIQHARNMEKTAVDDVNKRHKETTDAINAELASLDETESKITHRLKNLDNAAASVEAQVFVDVKIGEREAEAATQLQQHLQSTGTVNVRSSFLVDDKVGTFVREVGLLGKVVAQKPLKPVLKGTYDVGTEADETVSSISDICELDNGDILMADYNNICIKTFDPACKLVKYFKMPARPWGISRTSQNEVAITLTNTKEVQFVDIRGDWKMTTSFPVEERCRGIAYSRGEIYISIGGHPGNEDIAPEGPAFVGVYDTKGSLRRKIKIDSNGRQIFNLPYQIVCTHNGDKLHIADKKRGVITTDRVGSILSTFENVLWPLGLCVVDNDCLLVCWNESNNVIQITTDGELVAEILNQNDGIVDARCVFYSRKMSTLSVAFYRSNEFKVFNLLY